MRWWRGFTIGLIIGILAGGLFLAGYALGTRQHTAAGTPADFSLLWTVRDLLSSRFVDGETEPRAQVYGAVRGLVDSYKDRYTVFVEPATREVERDDLRGHFGGIGAYMGRSDAGEVVLTVMRDRPAARSGILDGDVLLAVDETEITPAMTISEIIALIRGDEGSQVALRLRRAGSAEPFTVSVVRERIDTPSVEWRVLDPDTGVGYIRLSIFGERTADELRSGLHELADAGTGKLVLDLRGNGGGLVDAAVAVTSQFLGDGQVLREIKRGGQERFYPVKRQQSPAHGWEIVLLVDGATASASEIVAGALRDQDRATIIGEKTFGKGSVQEVHELADGSSLHVTVARWLTPDRHEIDQVGIEPDLAVGISQSDRDAGLDPQLERARLWLAGEH